MKIETLIYFFFCFSSQNMKEDYGLFVWPCSIVLAEYVWQQRLRFSGASVVEVLRISVMENHFLGKFFFTVVYVIVNFGCFSLAPELACLVWLLRKWVLTSLSQMTPIV